MADITAINGAGSTAGITFNRISRVDSTNPPTVSPDRAEFSEIGQLLSTRETSGQQPIRANKVSEIRQAIADGTYETDDKIDYVVSRLLDVLHPQTESADN